MYLYFYNYLSEDLSNEHLKQDKWQVRMDFVCFFIIHKKKKDKKKERKKKRFFVPANTRTWQRWFIMHCCLQPAL